MVIARQHTPNRRVGGTGPNRSGRVDPRTETGLPPMILHYPGTKNDRAQRSLETGDALPWPGALA